MNKIIKADIYHDGEFFCARCLDFDIFTQGKTLDGLAINLKEAIQLHFEDDPEILSDYIPNPSIVSTRDGCQLLVSAYRHGSRLQVPSSRLRNQVNS